MNFQAYLEKLRAMPDHKKKQFALFTSLGFSVILLMFWLATLDSSINGSNSTVAKVAGRASTPAQSLVAGVGSIFGSVKDYFITPKVIEYKPLEAVPGK